MGRKRTTEFHGTYAHVSVCGHQIMKNPKLTSGGSESLVSSDWEYPEREFLIYNLLLPSCLNRHISNKINIVHNDFKAVLEESFKLQFVSTWKRGVEPKLVDEWSIEIRLPDRQCWQWLSSTLAPFWQRLATVP